jgi:hypothetical protein
MIDLIYLASTIGFFVVMLWYVRACAALGRPRESTGERP